MVNRLKPCSSSKQPDDRVEAAFSFEIDEGLAGQVKGGEPHRAQHR